MSVLYILSEDDSDTLFYEGCAEKVTGASYTPICRRMRKGAGIGAVRASLALVLGEISRMQEGSGAHFLVAMDNDRAPNTSAADSMKPEERTRLSKFDARKPDRYAALVESLEEKLGRDRPTWKVPIAVAMPVEMLESWLILIAREGTASDLPRFSCRDLKSARDFHGSTVPPQLKDLCSSIATADGYVNEKEWALALVTEKLVPDDLAERSPSFNLFKEWLDRWPKANTKPA